MYISNEVTIKLVEVNSIFIIKKCLQCKAWSERWSHCQSEGPSQKIPAFLIYLNYEPN